MATISQKQLFVWNDLENLGDLERLKLVLDYIPDENLVKKLENQRNEESRSRAPWYLRSIRLPATKLKI